MTSTRQRILDYLENHRTVTAEELSHVLHMTAANVRHHLAILRRRGLIEIISERPPKGRGRPTKVFSLSHQTIGENLDLLSSVLIKEAMGSKKPEEQKEFLRHIARLLIGKTKNGGSLTQRLFQAVRRLNEINYQSRWEAHAEAPNLILEHCPYLSIIKEHPELCLMDACLLEEILGVSVEQTAKLARDTKGGTYCMFKIRQKIK